MLLHTHPCRLLLQLFIVVSKQSMVFAPLFAGTVTRGARFRELRYTAISPSNAANVVLGMPKSSSVFDESQLPAYKRACPRDIKKPRERKFCRSILVIPFKKSVTIKGIKPFTFEIVHDLAFILTRERRLLSA
ncbi:hypothetical protein EJ06DRAFT_23804 [Trichodelitschia bisporula]|uniref:Uncharacterized protein n=1 Tax=Trichodelitschia bisporula TaxID=703511 RepID=A0A6G1IB96_9PEZI|nr:hypothetical protein EJ06DRAFT_23804 [Trichodelitschia bisporula]